MIGRPFKRIAAATVMVFAVLVGHPADAAFRLFSATLTGETNATVAFSATYPSTYGFALGNAFTVPRSIFTSYTVQKATGPGLPFFTLTAERKNLSGSFYAGILAPNLTTTLNANTTAYPNLSPLSLRNGYIRMIAGPNGFGGVMPLVFDDATKYRFITQLNPFYYDVMRTAMRSRGIGPLGKTDPAAAVGTRVFTFPPTSPTSYTRWASTTGPWITGTLTVVEGVGPYITNYTTFGVDNRNAAATTGTLSLVTPSLVFVYLTDGAGGINQLKDGFATTSTMTLTFIPETSRLALLGGGLLGLLGLARMRAR